MADFTAIADVSQSLVDLLTEGLASLGTTVRLDELQTAPQASNLLTLLLFQIREDVHSRNRAPTTHVEGQRVLIKQPPLALIVHYLLTPWAGNHEDNQRILGQALRTLHDNAIVSGPALRGSLNAANEAIHLSLVPLSLEEQFRVWHGLQKPYRLSLQYEARVIRIDSLSRAQQPMVRSRELATPAAGEARP